ncbi:alpha-ketoacid dehydrogenase subunit beta [Halopenitus sp. H-Gu1]|uniref:alpha-ketoacid dehydrogenase subunit beta n=1 Tax=Halopenitus sp. H-Gu1 TaxID=3242697 RepID=UPI00359E52A8
MSEPSPTEAGGIDEEQHADAVDAADEGNTEPDITIVQAVREGLYAELARDEEVIVMGEDVGMNGGVFRATEGLLDEFGDDRVVDTPLAESAIVGTSIGMASMGLTPVPEIQFSGFIYPAFDQIVSHLTRFRTRTQGCMPLQITLRAPYGGGIRAPEHHAESKEAFYVHEPGLKVVVPSTPRDTKGLLIASIRDPDPVIFLEPKLIYRALREAVPDEAYTVPIGEAATRRTGEDIVVYTWGAMTRPTLAAAETLAEEGISCEVLDLRTLSPLDREAIVSAFERTGRAAVVHEAPRTGGLAGEIATILQEEALLYQEAPIERITGFDVPYPQYAMEDYYLPNEARIIEGIREVVAF